jgi:hypothetical protein
MNFMQIVMKFNSSDHSQQHQHFLKFIQHASLVLTAFILRIFIITKTFLIVMWTMDEEPINTDTSYSQHLQNQLWQDDQKLYKRLINLCVISPSLAHMHLHSYIKCHLRTLNGPHGYPRRNPHGCKNNTFMNSVEPQPLPN